MSEKKLIPVCPTGHEGWFLDLIERLHKKANPAVHIFPDPITGERVTALTALPEKSILSSKIIAILNGPDGRENPYLNVIRDSPYLFDPDIDVTLNKEGVYRINVGKFDIENGNGVIYPMSQADLRVTLFNMRTPLTAKRILNGYREKCNIEDITVPIFTDLTHPFQEK